MPNVQWQARGIPVTYRQVDDDECRSTLVSFGFLAWQVDGILELCARRPLLHAADSRACPRVPSHALAYARLHASCICRHMPSHVLHGAACILHGARACMVRASAAGLAATRRYALVNDGKYSYPTTDLEEALGHAALTVREWLRPRPWP